MIKISFLGDIMCEPLMLKAAEKADGSYDFSGVFSNVKDLFSESDYIAGNLETPLAGIDAGFTSGLFSFNTPDEFADSVKMAGINFLSTANNHCMDRGLEGLKRTINVLDLKGIAHDGTYAEPQTFVKPFTTTVKDTKIAIIPYTYGTNYAVHHQALPEEGYVNLLHPDIEPVYAEKKKTKNRYIKENSGQTAEAGTSDLSEKEAWDSL